MREWYSSHYNLLALAYELHARGEFETIGDVLYFFERPWKWNDEWKAREERIAASLKVVR